MKVVEVGSGTARNADYLRDLVAARQTKRDPSFSAENIDYTATDIAAQDEKGRFLKDAAPGIHTRGGVDANALENSFDPESLDAVVGANPFGDWDNPGHSWGLRQTTQPGQRNEDMAPDTRFFQSARKVLKPGGKVRLFGRSDILGQKATPSPYVATTTDELKEAARGGFDVHVRHVRQDPRRKFERPDTQDRDKGRKDLGEFNSEFVFRKRKGGGGVKLHSQAEKPYEALRADSDEELEPDSLSTDKSPSTGRKGESKEEEEEDGV